MGSAQLGQERLDLAGSLGLPGLSRDPDREVGGRDGRACAPKSGVCSGHRLELVDDFDGLGRVPLERAPEVDRRQIEAPPHGLDHAETHMGEGGVRRDLRRSLTQESP